MIESSTIPEMIGEYTIVRRIGKGGMGEVWLARDSAGLQVAIKCPFRRADATDEQWADQLKRFVTEGETSFLKHENIARIVKEGTQRDGLPFLVMEYVDGLDLKHIFDTKKPLDLLFILTIVKQVCDGLSYAHEQGCFHRDIKPANIVIPYNAFSESEGGIIELGTATVVARIVDFGIAKMSNDELKEQLELSGLVASLPYCAPERLTDKRADGRMDVFSTGVMLYQLLTRELPFTGNSDTTVRRRIVDEEKPSLGEAYPAALDDILNRAMKKNPNERYASAEDFRDALVGVIEAEKKARVTWFVNESENRLLEGRYKEAQQFHTEARKLAEADSKVIELGKLIRSKIAREKQEKEVAASIAKAKRLWDLGNYTGAIKELEDAHHTSPNFPGLNEELQAFRDLKKRIDESLTALKRIDELLKQKDGDIKDDNIAGASRIAKDALELDPDNEKLQAKRTEIAAWVAKQSQAENLLNVAQNELKAGKLTEFGDLLAQAKTIRPSHPRIAELRQEMRRLLLENIQTAVDGHLAAYDYEKAADVLNQALKADAGERTLLSLKAKVDADAISFRQKVAASRAREELAETMFTAEMAIEQDHFDKAIEVLGAYRKNYGSQPEIDQLLEKTRKKLDEQQRELANQEKQRLIEQTIQKSQSLKLQGKLEEAIDSLASYRKDHGSQMEIDQLLADIRAELNAQQRTLAEQQQRALIEQTAIKARLLKGEGRLKEASELLVSALQNPAVLESGDVTLSNLLKEVLGEQEAAETNQREEIASRLQAEEASKLQAETLRHQQILDKARAYREDGKLGSAIGALEDYLKKASRTPEMEQLLSSLKYQRVMEEARALHKRGDLNSAISALEDYPRQGSQTTEMEQLLSSFKTERIRKLIDKAIAEAEDFSRKLDFPAALASLAAVAKAGRDHERVTRKIQEVETARSFYARNIVGESIEKALSTLAANRADAAISALRSSREMLEFADKVQQKEWNRLWREAKKRPGKLLIWLGVAAVCAVVSTVAFFGSRTSTPTKDSTPAKTVDEPKSPPVAPPPPVVTALATINITNTPPETLISVKDGPTQKTDKNGTLSLTLKPDTYVITASKDGYYTFNQRFPARSGSNPLNISMTKTVVTATQGRLDMVSNMPGFTVVVDGKKQSGEILGSRGSITLEQGQYTIEGCNEDGSCTTIPGKVKIAASGSTTVKFTLIPLLPNIGNLKVVTKVPYADISIDNKSGFKADAVGNLTQSGLSAGASHSVAVTSDRYLPGSGSTIIQKGLTATLEVDMKLKPSPVPPVAATPLVTTPPQGSSDSTPPAKVVVVPPSTPMKAEPPTPTLPTSALVTAARNNYASALNSFNDLKKIDPIAVSQKIKSVWLNPGSDLQEIQGNLQGTGYLKATIRNCSPPEFSPDGNSASQTCHELDSHNEGGKPSDRTFLFTYVKNNGNWVLSTRRATN